MSEVYLLASTLGEHRTLKKRSRDGAGNVITMQSLKLKNDSQNKHARTHNRTNTLTRTHTQSHEHTHMHARTQTHTIDDFSGKARDSFLLNKRHVVLLLQRLAARVYIARVWTKWGRVRCGLEEIHRFKRAVVFVFDCRIVKLTKPERDDVGRNVC